MKLLIVVLFVLIFGFWLVSDRFWNEVTVYNMFCTNGRVQGECKSEEQTANPTTYMISADHQTVVYWTGDNSPKRFTFCAVRDVYNWSCKFEKADETPTREYLMTDGKYHETATPPRVVSDIFYPVSRWHWWRRWLSQKFQ